MRLQLNITGFEWDKGNRDKKFPDVKHSTKEERNFAFGITNDGRLLTVVYTVRGSKIRVISARDMNRKEKKFYYEKTKAHSAV